MKKIPCTNCLIDRHPKKDFHNDKTKSSGKRRECKECVREKRLAYSRKNKKRVRAYNKKYYERNIKKWRLYSRNYYKNVIKTKNKK